MSILKNPYCQLMRLNKPVGIWLLLLPSLLGIWSAPVVTQAPYIIILQLYNSVLFAIGAIIMRSAGCVINDYFDINFDKKVARTQFRPLAQGLIKPRDALILFAVLSLIGLVILLQLPPLVIKIGLCAFVPIILYPLMKRITFFPQIFLGLIYNIGIIMGFVASAGFFDPNILWLYGFGVLITFSYDTIYAFQDIDDDQKIGVKSSAIIMQKNPKILLGFCYCIAFIMLVIFYHSYSMIAVIGILLGVILYYLSIWNKNNHLQTEVFFKKHCQLLAFIVMITIIYGLFITL